MQVQMTRMSICPIHPSNIFQNYSHYSKIDVIVAASGNVNILGISPPRRLGLYFYEQIHKFS